MKNKPIAIAFAGALAVSLAAISMASAHESMSQDDMMQGGQMMDHADTTQHGQMMGMMGNMAEMKQMMAACTNMMQAKAENHDAAMPDNESADEKSE